MKKVTGGSILREFSDKLNKRFTGITVPSFTPWTKWEQRGEIKGIDAPGVYVLAHLTRREANNADQLNETTVYFGRTAGSLVKRLNQFNRSASTGEGNHGGGKNYHEEYKTIQGGLHVSLVRVDWRRRVDDDDDVSEIVRKIFITQATSWLEIYLILNYTLRWGKLPRCNGAQVIISRGR